jgi:predicted Zn-dependent protease
MIALRMGDSANADRDLTNLLKVAPNDPGLLALHARASLDLGNLVAARHAADQALRLQPTSVHQRLLARIALAGGPPETLVVSDPGELATLPGTETSLHRDLLRIEEGPAPVAFDGRLQEAVLLSALGRQSEAEAEVSRLIAERPSSSIARRVFAEILCHAHQWERASSEVNSALALEANDSRLWLVSGRIQTELGHSRDARAALDRAIATGAGAKAYAERARMWMQSGFWRQAIGDWNRAVELDPDSPLYYVGRAACLRELGSPLDACAQLQYAADCAEEHPAAWRAIVSEARRVVARNPLRLPLLMTYANRLLQSRD